MQHIAAFESYFCKFQQAWRSISAIIGIGAVWLTGPFLVAQAQSQIDIQSDLAECKSLVIIGGLPIDCDEAFPNPHLHPLQPHPADVAWPTEAWETGTMPADTAPIVDELIAAAMAGEKTDIMGETRAIVIIHRGRLVAEAYRDGFGPDTKHVSWSMAKSITQALVGRAVQLGLIEDIDAPMPTPFAADDPRAAITWRQWLTMTDGLDYKEINATSLADNDVVNMMYGRGKYDVLAYVEEELPLIHEPGTHWNYSTAGFHLVSWALEQVVSEQSDLPMPAKVCVSTPPFNPDQKYIESLQDACSSFDARVMKANWWVAEAQEAYKEDPENSPKPIAFYVRAQLGLIGMDAQPEFDASGTFLGGSLVWASARDFAKFGYLYLRDGIWEAERLLPEGWVDFARTKTPAENANIYGAGWWITAYGEARSHPQNADSPPWDAFHAGGHEGQTIWVVPSKDLVIVRLGLMSNAGGNWEALYEWNQQIARAFPDVAE
jgi:CubicO group peptidase (beta-lactamase class C family)